MKKSLKYAAFALLGVAAALFSKEKANEPVNKWISAKKPVSISPNAVSVA